MISDANKVSAVLMAYTKVINLTTGKFVSCKVPEVGSQHWNNCLGIYSLCQENDIPIPSLMLSILEWYPSHWCEKIFRRPYPPVGVVCSVKARSKGLLNHPKTIKSEGPDGIAHFYFEQLRTINKLDIALELLEEFQLDQSVKEAVRNLLQERVNL